MLNIIYQLCKFQSSSLSGSNLWGGGWKHLQCYTESKKPQCMIKIWERSDRSCHTLSPTNNFSFYPLPILRCFWKDSLMTSHPYQPTSSIFHCYPLPSHHPCPPNKNFDHIPSAFRINEILTTLKQYFEGLRAIVNETNNNYQELNPLQYGGGGKGIMAPYRFFLCCIKKVCGREMKLSDF